MGVVSLLEAIMGTSVDLKGLETGLQKAERLAEEGAKRIQNHFGIMAVGIAAAIGGTVLIALEKAIKTTAEWGLEMEHLSNRMGMTSREAATLVGVMERFGVHSGIAARSMQMLSQQVHQTQNSLDPFATKLGKTLGTLRDTNNQLLSMPQVLDLVRQKVASAATDSDRLQIATSLLGARMGGQLIPMLKLSNEEWARQKASVEASLGPVEKAAEAALAYKQATAELEQTFRGLQVAMGTELLPILTDVIKYTSAWIQAVRDGKDVVPILDSFVHVFQDINKMVEEATYAYLYWAEKVGLVDKGTASIYSNMKSIQEETRKHMTAQEKIAEEAERHEHEVEMTEQNERKLVAAVRERVSLEEKAAALGLGGNVKLALAESLLKLEEQRLMIEKRVNDPTATADQRLIAEKELMKNRVESVELVSKATADMYKREELQLKSLGEFSLSSEIQLLQKKLGDERVVGDERLKLEAEIYQKRKQFAEDAIKVSRQLGFAGIDDEIAYRKQKAAELLGKGDALGAAGEIVKARDLAIKQADQVMELTKRIRVVSIQSEIEYQKQKLELVKGNAEEEMKILSQIADLDKQAYDQRLEFALNYTQKTTDAYLKMMKATGQTPTEGGAPGEQLTFAQAARDQERMQFQQARTFRDIAAHGGTQEARNLAIQQAQEIYKEVEGQQKSGGRVSEGLHEVGQAAQELLKAASGGAEVRAPGGPSPTIGSLLSPAEGLATATLARGSDIPRLDTSFTEGAIRVRHVLRSTTTYVKGFSTALQTAGQKLASQFGVAYTPGLGPGGGTTSLPTGTTPATNQQNPATTVAPGGTPVSPTPQVGVGSLNSSDIIAKLAALQDAIRAGNKDLIDALSSTAVANAESLQNALQQVNDRKLRVEVGIDPGSGDALVTRILQEVSQ